MGVRTLSHAPTSSGDGAPYSALSWSRIASVAVTGADATVAAGLMVARISCVQRSVLRAVGASRAAGPPGQLLWCDWLNQATYAPLPIYGTAWHSGGQLMAITTISQTPWTTG